MVKKETKLSTPTVLAFERKFDISDAVFFQKDSKDSKEPVEVSIKEKSVRGTISNFRKEAISDKLVEVDSKDKENKDHLKFYADIKNSNLQTVDVAMLDSDKDTLIVKWSCKVLPFNGTPNICNDQVYQNKLLEKVDEYIEKYKLEELALRYAYNIVNGRWLWRNRLGAENIDICIKYNEGKSEKLLKFTDAEDYTLEEFPKILEGTPKILEGAPKIDKTDFDILRELIKSGLNGKKFIIFEVESTLKVGYGQEVYPSQEFIPEDKNKSNKSNEKDKKYKKSKVLYRVDNKIAGMHSQKIGNAIRTIDTWWYLNDAELKFPIAVEPYGAVTTMGKAFRPSNNFYKLLNNWLNNKELSKKEEQQHYIMAVLIRGVVFGGKE